MPPLLPVAGFLLSINGEKTINREQKFMATVISMILKTYRHHEILGVIERIVLAILAHF